MPKGMTQSWIAAAATLPPEWELMGVVRGAREADPKIQSASWMAWARGPDGERVEGRGESPEEALDDFTNTMRKSRQAFKVELGGGGGLSSLGSRPRTRAVPGS